MIKSLTISKTVSLMMFLLHTASPDSTTKFGEGSQMNDIMEDIPHFLKMHFFKNFKKIFMI